MPWASEYDFTNYLTSGGVMSGGISSGQVGGNHVASGAMAVHVSQFGLATAIRNLSGQTATNSGAIITVSGTGLYCIGTYAVVSQGGFLNLGLLSMRIDWTDQVQSQNDIPVDGVALGTTGSKGFGTTVVRAASGTPIIMTVSLGSLVGAPVYDAYGAVTRIN